MRSFWLIAFLLVPAIAGGLRAQLLPASGPATSSSQPAYSPPVRDAQVARMIRETVQLIYAMHHPKDQWEEGIDHADRHYGGQTALCVYALLAAGEPPQNPILRDAIDFLKKLKMHGTYAIAMRINAFAYLPPQTVQAEMKADFQMLLHGQIDPKAPAGGLYDYLCDQPDVTRIDHSVSQVAVLGMWTAAQTGLDPGDLYWKKTELAWLRDQNADGSWAYDARSGASGSMTAAGVATLFITQDYLRAAQGLGCKGNITNEAIDKGLAWLEHHYAIDTNPGTGDTWRFYWLYTLERCGVASGRKYLGPHNWFDEGVRALAEARRKTPTAVNPDGDYGSLQNASFALLFLARGHRPVLMSKLQYDGPWNQRPRDAANVTRWIGKRFETELHWQSVAIDNPLREFHEAPILYIAGSDPLSFTDEQQAKLKQYVEEGGLIVAHADCGSTKFAESFKKMVEKLFPYPMRLLPADHTIYHEAPMQKSLPLWGQSNGLRELCILMADGDPARAWQAGKPDADLPLFELAQNIYFYSCDKTQLRKKGDMLIPEIDPGIRASRAVRLARLKHPGQWDPEPGGWRRMAAILHNENHLDVTLDTLTLGEGQLPGYELAHITGMEGVALTDDQVKELRTFIGRGGTLIVDAAGGASDFIESMRKPLSALIVGGKLEPLTGTEPIFADTHPLPEPGPKLFKDDEAKPAGDEDLVIEYRRAARARLGNLKAPRLMGMRLGRRWAVIISPDDLSSGLTGRQMDGICGYSPATATEMVRRIVVNATAK